VLQLLSYSVSKLTPKLVSWLRSL